MQVINLVSDSLYYNLYTLTGYTQGQTLVVHNNTVDPLFVVRAVSQPSPTESQRDFIEPGAQVIIYANGQPIWIKGTTGPLVVHAVFERTVLPFNGIDLPHDVYTANKELYRRIKVDPGQTSFHDGREFRTFYEFNIPTGQSVYIQANVAVDSILYDVSCVVDSGAIRLTTQAGATGTGTYNVVQPIFPKNTMSIRSQPIYPAANTLFRGGTGFTGGTTIDTIRIVAANATAQQTSVGSKAFDQRGVGVGTYYWRLENISNSAATGTFSGWWAEILNLGV